MSLLLQLSQHRWKLAAALIIVVGAASWLSLMNAPSSTFVAMQTPGAEVTAAAIAANDVAVARAVAMQQSLQQAEQALLQAEPLGGPEVPAPVTLWAATSDPLVTPSLVLNPAVDQAEVVQLPASAVLEALPGDRLTVPLPAGRSLAVMVEEATRLPSGDYTWRGYVEGEGDDFPVIFTVGKNSAFATITSWEGSYTMEAVNGVGWLYRNIVDPGEDSVPVPMGEETSHHH